ncbi:MAG: hypothetical protein P4M15_12290 [Alphaproteobacteria bacterium]|nr:hypothetical protein [Alphaproteobacteria bacterium]
MTRALLKVTTAAEVQQAAADAAAGKPEKTYGEWLVEKETAIRAELAQNPAFGAAIPQSTTPGRKSGGQIMRMRM